MAHREDLARFLNDVVKLSGYFFSTFVFPFLMSLHQNSFQAIKVNTKNGWGYIQSMTLLTLNFSILRAKVEHRERVLSRIFRGETTISRRTLTPNLIGCFHRRWKGSNQWKAVCVVASIPLRTWVSGDGEGKLDV